MKLIYYFIKILTAIKPFGFIYSYHERTSPRYLDILSKNVVRLRLSLTLSLGVKRLLFIQSRACNWSHDNREITRNLTSGCKHLQRPFQYCIGLIM